jgi:hypothetical protein
MKDTVRMHPGLSRTLLAAAAVLATQWATPAAAQSENARRAAAKALLQEGGALYAKESYAEALAKFRDAYEVFRSPKILFNIAQCELRLKRERLAATTYSAFLDQTLEAKELASQRQTAREQLAQLVGKLSRLKLELSPQVAQLQIDGAAEAGREPFVDPGKHTLTVSAAGYVTQTQEIEVRAAEAMRVAVSLQAVAPEPRPKDVPDVVPKPTDVPRADPNPPILTNPPLVVHDVPPERSTRAWAGWGTVAGGGVLVVGSGVVGLLASMNNSTLAALAVGQAQPGSRPSDAAGLRSSVKGESIASTVMLGAGLVAVGVGIYLLVTDSPSANHSQEGR